MPLIASDAGGAQPPIAHSPSASGELYWEQQSRECQNWSSCANQLILHLIRDDEQLQIPRCTCPPHMLQSNKSCKNYEHPLQVHDQQGGQSEVLVPLVFVKRNICMPLRWLCESCLHMRHLSTQPEAPKLSLHAGSGENALASNTEKWRNQSLHRSHPLLFFVALR